MGLVLSSLWARTVQEFLCNTYETPGAQKSRFLCSSAGLLAQKDDPVKLQSSNTKLFNVTFWEEHCEIVIQDSALFLTTPPQMSGEKNQSNVHSLAHSGLTTQSLPKTF